MPKTKSGAKKDWSRTRQYRELRDQMLDDLREAGLWTAYFREKVDRYMGLWCIARELEQDLRDRGLRVEYRNGSQHGETENKSMDRLMKVYDRMDELHRELGYQDQVRAGKQAAVRNGTAEDDDDL